MPQYLCLAIQGRTAARFCGQRQAWTWIPSTLFQALPSFFCLICLISGPATAVHSFSRCFDPQLVDAQQQAACHSLPHTFLSQCPTGFVHRCSSLNTSSVLLAVGRLNGSVPENGSACSGLGKVRRSLSSNSKRVGLRDASLTGIERWVSPRMPRRLRSGERLAVIFPVLCTQIVPCSSILTQYAV